MNDQVRHLLHGSVETGRRPTRIHSGAERYWIWLRSRKTLRHDGEQGLRYVHRWRARYVCEGFCGFSADYFVSRFACVKQFLGQGFFYFSHQATKAPSHEGFVIFRVLVAMALKTG